MYVFAFTVSFYYRDTFLIRIVIYYCQDKFQLRFKIPQSCLCCPDYYIHCFLRCLCNESINKYQ